MKNLLKSITVLSIAITLFSCKEEPIEKPDSLTPVEVTIADINTGKYKDQTVTINDVYFVDNVGKFNDSGSNSGGNRDLTDCDGNIVIVFTYATDAWALQDVPDGLGPITGVVSEYNGTIQFLMRSIDDVSEMINPVCGITPTTPGDYFYEDFNPEPGTLTANNAWTTQVVVPSASSFDWYHDGFSGDGYAKISNYVSATMTNEALETWLITPAIDLTSSTIPKFNFRMTKRHPGDDIVVYISTDYDGSSAPSSATWVDITSTITLDADDTKWTFVDSGDADISAYKSATTYIAFKYLGGTTNGSTWELDNISVFE